jgi:hypothetical protein
MSIDYSRLREQTIGSTVDAEAVTVNTRALIDKVLARYSGDWTTLRELIQNAADASATKVTLRFETLPSRTIPVPHQADQATLLNHTISNHTIQRLVVSNNGAHFGDSDWARLKRIAEGNPDETKIGAFGVGFYSVFADCEEPFIISGRKTMAFLWKKDSLFTKASSISAEQPMQDTCFVLNYRSTTSAVPDLLSICKFLTTSLTFVGLQEIEFWVDNWKILRLHKKASPEVTAQIPAGINTKTKEGLMKIVSVTNQSTQIDATWMNIIGQPKSSMALQAKQVADEAPVAVFKSFFSKIASHATSNSAAKKVAREIEVAKDREILENLHLTSQATVFLRVSTVNIQTSVSGQFAAELERATKKPPPKRTKIAILTASKDETAASLSSSSGITEKYAEEVFASVLPNKHGRVFIGFPTAQTTGMLCHISAPSVIPTVERENIDLNARYVKTWNTEMLRVAGIACRVAYTDSFDNLKRNITATWKSNGVITPKESDVEPFVPQATHIFKQYTAQESTPSYQVGQLIEEAFWECTKRSSIDVLSSRGVLPSSQVRVVLQPLSFLQNIPIIPAKLAEEAQDFVGRLYRRNLITDLSVTDVRKELEAQALPEDQVLEFLKWLSNQAIADALDHTTIQTLLNAAVGTYQEEPNKSKMVVLSEIKTFMLGSKIPPTMPVPETTIPFMLTKGLASKALEKFGWEELEVVPWTRWLIESAGKQQLGQDHNIVKSPEFATSVLQVLSKQWDQLSANSRNALIALLSARPILPTKLGLRVPSEAYFANVKIFDDLPTVSAGLKVKDKFLVAMGVRKTVELNVVFERLMAKPEKGSDKPTWSFKDLVHYLIEVESDIPSKDIQRLRTAEICPLEITKEKETSAGPLLAISQLYFPKDIHRKLSLPVLYWPGTLSPGGPEARFLKSLGLRPHPSVHELFEIMVRESRRSNAEVYTIALNYYLENYDLNGYSAISKSNYGALPILPVEGARFPKLYSPKGCYTNEQAAVLGYPILQASLRPHGFKFGVQPDPPMASCVETIIGNPPLNRQQAIDTFGYFASRLGNIDNKQADTLSFANIVPVPARNGKGAVKMTSPRMCFLGDPSAYGNILDFVDFDQAGNSFLLKVGAKHEPTSIELAIMLKNDPFHVLGVLGEERYLELLGRLAENATTLKHDKPLWKQLKESPFLISYRDVVNESKKQSLLEELDAYDEEKIQRELSLRKAADIVVEDSYREYAIFRSYLYAAPPEPLLEKFYTSLGVPNLRSILQLDQRVGSIKRDQNAAVALRKLLVERSRLFLHEYQQDILHDSKWLDKNLNVVATDSLNLTISLQGYRVPPHKENKSAVISTDRKACTLYVIDRPDLYEVSRCIVPLLLSRPKQHDVMALEMVLTSDLRRLRHKGYNVERILRKQEYETRMAEQERQAREAEDQRLAESQRKEAEKQQKLRLETRPPPPAIGPPPSYETATDEHPTDQKGPAMPTMPGGFEPETPSPQRPKSVKGSRDLFSQVQDWGKKFGTNIRQLQGPGGASSSMINEERSLVPNAPGHANEPVPPTDAVNSDRNVQQNLTNAIKASRPFGPNNLFAPPQQTNVEQAKSGSYCDTTTAQDLVAAGTTLSGLKLYLARSLSQAQLEELHSKHTVPLGTFSSLLLDLASIFNLPPTNMHVYYDPASSSIAFNTAGALFFNYHYFASLHLPTFSTSRDRKIDAVAYWFVTICHELAHNLVKEHSAAHSFYTESFASQYFARAMQKALQY